MSECEGRETGMRDGEAKSRNKGGGEKGVRLISLDNSNKMSFLNTRMVHGPSAPNSRRRAGPDPSCSGIWTVFATIQQKRRALQFRSIPLN
jgi:hypothetical protein